MGEVREITVEEPDLKDLEEFLNIPLHRARTARELAEEREKEKEKEGLSGEVRQAERGQGLEAGRGASKESEAGRQSIAEREPGAGRQSIAEQEPGAGQQSIAEQGPGAGRQFIAEQEPEFEKLLEGGQDSRPWEQTTGSFQGKRRRQTVFRSPLGRSFPIFWILREAAVMGKRQLPLRIWSLPCTASVRRLRHPSPMNFPLSAF